MNIIIVTPSIPYPPHRGDKLRMFNICKMLIKNNNVKLLTFIKDKSEQKNVDELLKLGIDVETIGLTKKKSYLNLYRSLVKSDPMQVAYFHSKAMHERITELTDSDYFDVAYFHLVISAQYGKAVKNKKILKVIDFTDSTSLYLQRHVKTLGKNIKALPFLFEKYKVLNYEKKCAEFDTLFICSNVDKEYLEKRKIHNNIKLFLNGFDPNEFKYKEVNYNKNRIMFSGNMPYLPNHQGVMYFAKEIFPLVLKKYPDAVFYIVGQNPSNEIQELRSANIIVTGFVEDIKMEYLLSAVNVAPIKFGAGTPNKITEALALGIPTISTSLAVSGLPENLKQFIFLADEPELFADYVVKILKDESIRENLIKNGRKEIEDTLSMEKIVNKIELYLKERLLLKQKD